MKRPHIAIIDPGSRVAELDAFNRLQDLTHGKLSYHLPCIFGMETWLSSSQNSMGSSYLAAALLSTIRLIGSLRILDQTANRRLCAYFRTLFWTSAPRPYARGKSRFHVSR